MRALIAVALAIVCMGVTGCSPTDPRETFELAEKCGKDAAEWFKRSSDNTIGRYTNHYNRRSNRCYALHVGHINPQNNDICESLYDVNENRELGWYMAVTKVSVICQVEAKKCSSFQEWRVLVKPYMSQ